MSTQVNRRNTLYGYPNPQAGLQQEPIVKPTDPTVYDTAELGTVWVNTTSQSFFILCSVGAAANVWTATTGGAETLTALTVNPGNLTVTAGNVIVTAGNLTMAAGSSAALGSTLTADMSVNGTFYASGDASFGGTVGISGVTVIDNNLTVTGDVTVNGDFDLTSADAISLTTTSNTDPAISLTANGGTTERIIINAIQGTDPAAIELLSTVGGISLSGGLDDGNAINLDASNAAGGMTFVAGTNGFVFSSTNGEFTVATETGLVAISADAHATTIDIGTGTAVVKTIAIGGTGANVITIGNAQTAGSVAIGTAMTTGTVSIGGTGAQTGTVSLAPGTGAQTVNIATGGTGIKTVNIGTGAVANVLTLGTNTGAASLSLLAGTGNMEAVSDGTLTISSVGATTIDATTGAISIGGGANAQAINVGTGAAARTVTVGNSTGATSVVVNVGTGALNLGTNATVHATAVGSTTAGCTLALNTPVGTPVVANAGISITDITSVQTGLSLPGGVLVLSGGGSPAGIVTGAIGSLYLRTDGSSSTTRAYINTSGGTAWTSITTAT